MGVANVVEIVERSIENSENQLSAMKAMLEQVKLISNETKLVSEKVYVLANDVSEAKKEISQFEKEFKDTNRLLPSEIDELFMSVVDKSTELAKVRNHEEDEKFTKIVGKYRKMIWSKLKKRFGVSKYIHIKRVDFEPCMEFIKSFNPEDYI